jgi:Zn-dependent M28 family amino/carboxypeptidase
MTKAKEQGIAGNYGDIEKIKPGKITYATEMMISEVETENVLGYLEGSDKKDELVIVTAHYDHIGRNGEQINNGADDDGSGTTSVMEIAQAFVEAKKAGHGPRRSMLFMTVTGEEKGLLGSAYYTNNPIFPLENTVVDLNIDMIGRTDEAHVEDREFVYLVGSNRLSSELHDLSEEVNKTFTNLSLDYTYNDENHPDRIYYRSDHWNFAKNNVPVIFYFNGTHDDYHRPTDTVDKIEFDLLQKRAQLVFYTAWVVANRDNRLVVDQLEDEQLMESH